MLQHVEPHIAALADDFDKADGPIRRHVEHALIVDHAIHRRTSPISSLSASVQSPSIVHLELNAPRSRAESGTKVRLNALLFHEAYRSDHAAEATMPVILWLLGVPLVVVIALMVTHII